MNVEVESKRKRWLSALVRLDLPATHIERALHAIPWDDGRDRVVLSAQDARTVLRRVLAGHVGLAEVGRWAELIECRDDVEYEAVREDVLKRLILELANPALYEPLTLDVARRWLQQLERAA